MQNGHLLENDGEWTKEVACDFLVSDYTAYAEKWKFNRRGNETALGRFLARVCPHVQRTQNRIGVEEYDQATGRSVTIKKRVYFYDFGTLEVAREAWDRIHGKTKWETPMSLKNETIKTPF